ncbi:hypothetical protein [uncultured Amaricoccus sp.]|uniref:hypothetical protein n=1 Tax=uncultured Amaricoccus sp. TaxID=339341 RepID=UPI00261F2F46|nr:hypothetical protein [uncultured Amaricoccus sp.]
MHAKIVVGPSSTVAGSANFSRAGQRRNVEWVEAFDSGAPAEARRRFVETIWKLGVDWNAEALEALDQLLRPVPAADAIAGIIDDHCSFKPFVVEVLEGSGIRLAPFQIDLVVESARISYEHGYVVVVAPPGSGKTEIGKALAIVLQRIYKGCMQSDRFRRTPRTSVQVVAPARVVKNWSRDATHLSVLSNTRHVEFERFSDYCAVIVDESHSVASDCQSAWDGDP